MRPGAWLVNAARGPVVDGAALLAARRSGRLGALVLDCWPGEPAPDPALVAAADIATPHIAGYSAEGKLAGTAMLARALRDWLAARAATGPAVDGPAAARAASSTSPGCPIRRTGRRGSRGSPRQAYDVRADDARFRAAMDADPTRRPRRRLLPSCGGRIPSATRTRHSSSAGRTSRRRRGER